MSALGIFIYGIVVTALVATALGLLAWGIVKERRDRSRPEQGAEVFGAPAAAYLASDEETRREQGPTFTGRGRDG